MVDEKYVYLQDLREKKVTGYSARKQRSHCGKAGCKLPSDYLSKKEIKNMSGECKSYRLNEPMTYAEFRLMPIDLQKTYIMALRQKYNAPVSMIGKMMGVERAHLSKYLREVLGFENFPHGNHSWDKVGFMEWAYGVPKAEECQSVQETVEEEPVEVTEAVESVIPDGISEKIEECEAMIRAMEEDFASKKAEDKRMYEAERRFKKTVPTTGSMTYEGKTFNILSSLADLLGNAKVLLSVKWDVLED